MSYAQESSQESPNARTLAARNKNPQPCRKCKDTKLKVITVLLSVFLVHRLHPSSVILGTHVNAALNKVNHAFATM